MTTKFEEDVSNARTRVVLSLCRRQQEECLSVPDGRLHRGDAQLPGAEHEPPRGGRADRERRPVAAVPADDVSPRTSVSEEGGALAPLMEPLFCCLGTRTGWRTPSRTPRQN